MRGASIISMFVVMSMIQIMAAKPGDAAIGCGQVDSYLAPCIPYLTTGNGDPAPKCCEGIQNLKANTPTVDDRRAACACVKDAANRYPVKDAAASSLPTKCGVVISIPISKAINCQTIN
ncbi:Non-specific lipid-transfer protein A [Linum grandiflorum]